MGYLYASAESWMTYDTRTYVNNGGKMEVGKVRARGHITLPRAIRKVADIKAGDFIGLKVVGPGRVELHVVSRMTLEEAFERYRVEGPIDEAADREAWQDVATRDAIGE